jgi:hypothetical protein
VGVSKNSIIKKKVCSRALVYKKKSKCESFYLFTLTPMKRIIITGGSD